MNKHSASQPLESLHYKNNKLHSATESSKFNCNIKVDSLLLQKASLIIKIAFQFNRITNKNKY
jgi:hypothetical protein